METVPLLIPLLIAFSSGLHCLGMCGGIIGAMALNLPVAVKERRWGVVLFLLAANLGRLLSYGAAGWLTARFGQSLFLALSPGMGHGLLQGLAALMLVGTGLFLSGRFPGLRWLENLGAPLWRRLEPLGRHLITPRTPLHALLFGMVWGWLPCSMVYSALVWSAAACSPERSALLMVLFGLGTLPATLPTGWLAGRVTVLAKQPWLRDLLAMALVAAGAFSLYMTGQHFHDPFMHQWHSLTTCTDPSLF